MTRRENRIKNLALEPLVFCYSDIWPDNFLIDNDNTIVVDFADVSILPSSFSKFALKTATSKMKCDMTHLVIIPMTDGVDNTPALLDVYSLMSMGSSSFATSGRRLLGDEKNQDIKKVRQLLTNEQGSPVTVSFEEDEGYETEPAQPPPPPPGPCNLMTI